MSRNKEYVIETPFYNLAAIEYGDENGLPVLAAHGWLDNAASFEFLARHLKGIRLIAIDLIGHGLSDHRPPAMPYHIWDNVTDIHAVTEALGLKKLNLIGHSMGGSVMMLFAGAFPEQVERLALIEGVAPLVYPADELPQLFSQAVLKREKMKKRPLKPYAAEADAIRVREQGRWPLTQEAAELLVSRALKATESGYIWRHDPKLMMPSLVRFCPEQVCSFIHSVTAETDVIVAKEGASAQLISQWTDSFQQVRVTEMEGSHHLHMTEPAAEKIAAIINKWVV